MPCGQHWDDGAMCPGVSEPRVRDDEAGLSSDRESGPCRGPVPSHQPREPDFFPNNPMTGGGHCAVTRYVAHGQQDCLLWLPGRARPGEDVAALLAQGQGWGFCLAEAVSKVPGEACSRVSCPSIKISVKRPAAWPPRSLQLSRLKSEYRFNTSSLFSPRFTQVSENVPSRPVPSCPCPG